jgi:hypothetical protein
MTFTIDAATNHYSYYELILKESLTMRRNGAANSNYFKSSLCCRQVLRKTTEQLHIRHSTLTKKLDFNYESLSNAYDRIYNYIIGTSYWSISRAADYLTAIQYHDEQIGNHFQI